MTLASVLLQPQRFARVSVDPDVRLMDDVGRLIAVLAEDAVNDGPMAQALLDAAIAMGPRLQQELESRFRDVAATLRIRAQALVTSLEALGDEITAVGDDNAKAIAFATRLLGIASDFVDTLTYPGLRERVQFAVDVLEKDLGLSATFIEGQILAFLNDAADRIAALDDGGDLGVRRQRRAAASTLRRLAHFLHTSFRFPALDVDAITRTFYDLLRQAGIEEAVRQARCAIGEFETAVAGAQALGGAVSFGGVSETGPSLTADDVEADPQVRVGRPEGRPLRSAVDAEADRQVHPRETGAIGETAAASAEALVTLSGQPTYAWYASWLLESEDLPFFGLSSFTNAARLIVTIRDSTEAVPDFVRDRAVPGQLQALAGVVEGTEPTREQKLAVLALLNKVIQGELIYDSERFPTVPHLPDDLLNAQIKAIDDNDVLRANRRFISHLFQSDLVEAPHGCLHTIKHGLIGALDLPRNRVSVSVDRRFIMCDDMPLLMGENLKWQDAPIFSNTERGQTFWIFAKVKEDTCEGFAYHLAWPTTLGKAVWHLVNIIRDQPGHRVGSGVAVSLEFAEALNQLIFGRPVNGYEELGGFGRWLSSGVIGPRAVSIFLGSFQGMHTKAAGYNIFYFWGTVLFGDIVRTASPSGILGTVREVILAWITLVNFGGPRLGESTLPKSPAQNRLKQGPINSLMNTLFGLWLVSYYKREDYSVAILSDDSGDRRARALKLWLGGGLGMGILAGISAALVSQITAWAEDFAGFGKTVAHASLIMVLQFWILEYFQGDGGTDGGRYNPRGPRNFKGYPNKDTSPYRLPWAKGDALYVVQGNQGFWSHNDISNIGADQQCYAFDFGHDHQQPVHAARGGIVYSFTESNPDNSDGSPNTITILHDVNDAEHDDPFVPLLGPDGKPIPAAVTTYATYLHGAFNGITDAFASRGLPPPVKESASPGNGTRVAQGDVIMLADDTGNSFHSHMHMHVLMDTSGGVVAPGAANGPGDVGIPFVFREVRGEGRPLNMTWYESENG